MKTKIRQLLATVLASALLAISLPSATAAAAETVTLSSNQGTIGQQITITGTGFTSTNVSRGVNVLFGEFAGDAGGTMDYSANVYQRVQVAELNSDGTFSSVFTVPAALNSGTTKKAVAKGSYYVIVTYYYPTFSPPDGTTIVQVKPFSVLTGLLDIVPNGGPTGTEVAITGTFFGNSETVSLSYDGFAVPFSGSPVTSATGTFGPATITIPPGSGGQHFITVTGAVSGIASQAAFTVRPKASISPNSGAAGQLVTASGSGFGGQTDVSIAFAGVALTPARTDFNGSFSIIFPALPRGPGNYDVVFRDAAGNTANLTFTLTATTLSLSPESARVDSSVMVSGANYLPSRPLTVTLGDSVVTSTTTSGQGTFSVSFNVPAVPSGAYQVNATDGTNNGTADFTVTSSLEIVPRTSVTSPGSIGTEVSITGAGFNPEATVVVSYDGTVVATTTAGVDRTFAVKFKIPASQSGEHIITVTDGDGTERATYYVESEPPPAPNLVSPETGVKTSTAPQFDWQDISDSSGVTYTLQVATSESFSVDSVRLEQTDIGLSQYPISNGQQLEVRGKDSPYYWRVRATDGAGNIGLWSNARTFYVGGGLPQVVIYVLIGAGVVGLIALAFWLGKRTALY